MTERPISRTDKGKWAEAQAATFLTDQGWTIVTRNFCIRGGEIDLIAYDNETLVFVEVRSRSSSSPEESIDAKKVASIRRTAREYVKRMGLSDPQIRFDLIAIEGKDLRHHPGSISADGVTAPPIGGDFASDSEDSFDEYETE